jgi:pimeloyl-ACP methyl ester carboxylesterase
MCGLASACAGGGNGEESKRFPTSADFPQTVMTRTALVAGGGHGWRLSALYTPNRSSAPWKVVVVTGTPSWPEYWAPTLAKIGPEREMIVADRPGFALSEPKEAVTSIKSQAEALSAMLEGPEGQKVILIGQSYGGPVAATLAAMRPDKVKGLVLMSAFFGERGPTARRLDGLGSMIRPALPRDLKNSLSEIANQKPQLPAAIAALEGLNIPIVVLHGDKDTFLAPGSEQRLAAINPRTELMVVAGGDHFLNACCVDQVVAAAESVIAKAQAP